MSELTDKLIVALDVDALEQAKRFIDILYPTVKYFKIGSQLFTACGPEAVRMVGSKGAKAFLDLKFHDIPNTVHSAVSAAIATYAAGVFMMTVHIRGGEEMLRRASAAAREKAAELKITKPYIVGVTRLTSDKNTGILQDEVLAAAELAKNSGLDGVVCAVQEAGVIRKRFGKDFIVVTPGIRPKSADSDDQKRIATAAEAIKAGSDFLVVGRPVLEAEDPLEAAKGLFR